MAMLGRRAFGTEIEYGLAVSRGGGGYAPMPPSSINFAHEKYGPPALGALRKFLINGACLYEDHWHSEYATPEVTSLRQLLAIELGGEEIVRDAFEAWEAREGRGCNVMLNKRSMSESDAWGYHFSIQTEREAWQGLGSRESERLYGNPAFQALGLHLATANIFVGSGGVYGDAESGYQFVLAQKAMHLTDDFHLDTVDHKPVVNLRNEALADPERFARLHITSQDPNISPWASLMKWGTNLLVVSCIEEGIFPEWPFTLRRGDLRDLARHTAMDLTCKQPFQFVDGHRATAVEIQEMLYKAAVRLSNKVELSEELQWVLAEWGRAIADIKISPVELLKRADWPLRHRLLGRYVLAATKPDENGMTGWGHSHVRLEDMKFDRLTTRSRKQDGSPADDMPTQLRKTLWLPYMPTREEIDHYKEHAPDDTRAHVREQIVRRLYGTDKGQIRNWVELRLFMRNRSAVVGLPDDPRVSDMPDLDKILEIVQSDAPMTLEQYRWLTARWDERPPYPLSAAA